MFTYLHSYKAQVSVSNGGCSTVNRSGWLSDLYAKKIGEFLLVVLRHRTRTGPTVVQATYSVRLGHICIPETLNFAEVGRILVTGKLFPGKTWFRREWQTLRCMPRIRLPR